MDYPSWLGDAARHYSIDIDEARRRWDVMHDPAYCTDTPEDPICIGCTKKPEALDEYVDAVVSELAPGETYDDQDVKRYVIQNEGTYNPQNGHFMCTDCYIINGQPSRPAPDHWVAP
jgi:hypothetical protein